jgi:hypothetical protein
MLTPRLFLGALLASSAYAAIPTTITLTSSTNPVVYGQPVTLTATVSPSTATGYIAFYDGVAVLETETAVNGQATFTTSQLPSGMQSLKARFVSSPFPLAYASSTSSALSETVTVNAEPSGAYSGKSAVSGASAVVGDINGDGHADIVTYGGFYNYYGQFPLGYVFLGNGDGTFQSPLSYSPGVLQQSIALGDFNGDGKMDIAAPNAVFLGNGDGTFQAPLYLQGGGGDYVAVADFNGDGIADLLVGVDYPGAVNVFLGIGDGTFQSPMSVSLPGPFAFAVADFNNDGYADVIAVYPAPNYAIGVMLGNGDGTFQPQVTTTFGADWESVAVADFNGDGKPDVVLAWSFGLAVLLGNGDGTFQQPLVNLNGPGTPVAGTSIAIGDFNGDGKPDIAADDMSSPGIPTGSIYILYGNGDGTFQAPAPFAANANVGSIAAGEFNGDGVTDLAVGTNTYTLYPDLAILLGVEGPCVTGITSQPIAFDATGGSQTLNITTTGPSCAWTVSASATWIQLSAYSGTGSATITAAIVPNTTGADLSGTITVVDGAYQNQLASVTQTFTVQTFSDVPLTAYFFDAVNLMAAKNITSGCAPDMFCPWDDVTRAEMAIFIVRTVMGGDSFTYTQTPYFTDVLPGSFGFAWIQKLRDLGITSGCTATTFCPSEAVTRAQMAIFVIRARYGAATVFDYPQTAYFQDVGPVTAGYQWIQRLREDNITAGCSPELYCPSNPVTRGDMAIFIMRGGFNQLLPSGEGIITAVTPNSWPMEPRPPLPLPVKTLTSRAKRW